MLDELVLKPYFVDPATLPKHQFYERSVMITEHLEAHSKGKYPKDIIEIARPNETFEQKEYRKLAYTPVTKTYFSKVVSTVAKIRRAEDWSVVFPDQPGVPEDETLEKYVTENYPNFDSLQNWFFSLQLREMCDDPNGVVAVFPYPKKNPDDDSEYLRPFTFWFESEDVIDFREGEFAVLRSSERSLINIDGKPAQRGLVYYVFDKDSWAVCTQVGELKDYKFISQILSHPVGHLPCFKIGGIIEEFKNGQTLYDSFVGDCLPFWDEAIRRYSDLQVQMVLHVHSEKWEIEDTPCKTCKGSGEVMTQYMGGKSVSSRCGTCNGLGCHSPKSPFGVKTIKSANKVSTTDAISVPIPPMGYIDKPIEQTQFIHDQVYENIQSGLAAINMEFLTMEPEVNSGVAKTLDRQEMNSFFYTVAAHIVNNIFQPSIYFISKWRHGTTYVEEKITAIQPAIKTPTDYDILTEDIIIQRISTAKQAGLSAKAMAELEIEFFKKEFGDNSTQVQMLTNSLLLDPLPNLSVDEKMTVLANRGCSQEEYILSSKLSYFINRAVNENKDFLTMPYSDKQKILDKYVAEAIAKQQSLKVPIVNSNGE
jgi:hypothetical protein